MNIYWTHRSGLEFAINDLKKLKVLITLMAIIKHSIITTESPTPKYILRDNLIFGTGSIMPWKSGEITKSVN